MKAAGSAASARSRGGVTVRSVDGTGSNAVLAVQMAGLQRTPADVLARVTAFIRDIESAKRFELDGLSVHGSAGDEDEDSDAAGAGAVAGAAATSAAAAGGQLGNSGPSYATALASTRGVISALERTTSPPRQRRKQARYVLDREAAQRLIIPYGGTWPQAIPLVLKRVEFAYEEPHISELLRRGR